MLNETHALDLKSWVESANQHGCDFPVQNLPHGVFRRRGTREVFRGGVAIGDMILDMQSALTSGVFSGSAKAAAEMAGASTLNGLMSLGTSHWSVLRLALSRMLRAGAPERPKLQGCLLPQTDAEFALPAQIGDYTDFFTSYHHMLNAGRIFQPDKPELPNFKWLPIAYHGRSSSVQISGSNFHRPMGQTRPPGVEEPIFGPTKRLDYEMELGFYIGPGNALGRPIPIDESEDHIFGVCLLNDWSARDVQGWESQPLGPFLAKNFITSVSPWIVTLEALAPYRCELPRQAGDPPILAHLRASGAHAADAFDIQLEACLQTTASGEALMRLSHTSFKHGYWSLAQMLTHHAEGGCNLRPGDLMGTGTQSGPDRGEEGCLLELSVGGREPVKLANGETRTFLEDGDTVVLRGWCQREGFARIGFGVCSGTVLPAMDGAHAFASKTKNA